MDIYEQSLALHQKYQGKYSISSKVPVASLEDLSLAYSPGVAAPCLAIAKDKEKAYLYTSKGSTIAVISDGSAVLGLGNIGPDAAAPVMEGKAILFKEFGGVNAIPLCLATQDTAELIRTIALLAPSLGGINLEDISSPRCFEIEQALIDQLDIPVFHDDQHGTAVVVAAAIINANRLTGRKMSDLKLVVSGLGAAGVACVKMLYAMGVRHIVALNSKGVVTKANAPFALISQLFEQGVLTDVQGKTKLAEVIVDSDVFIGVSAAKVLSPEMVQSMAKDPYIFALANPEPEILPSLAYQAGAFVVGTGRSDFANQINNVLAFPGIFHGVLACRAKKITQEMKVAAVHALAHVLSDQELSKDQLLPAAFDPRVVPAISQAVIAEVERAKNG
jgi:malate dehydrogenase (oxaloacetate-decarboxylating)